jgi:alpha-L-fucosidase
MLLQIEEDRSVLLSIGDWLKLNGEGIYGTTYWKQFGEGPTKVTEGAFTDVNRAPFTAEDIRFTYKNGVIYAFVLRSPEDGIVKIAALKKTKAGMGMGDFDIKGVSVLGYDIGAEFNRDTERLEIRLAEKIDTRYPICLKIAID